MRLLGFNTGRIRSQVIDGEAVTTAYVKEPVAEPWIITETGPAGNEVAAHTDHLYAFDREAYDFWADELGVARDAWPDGHFAENLTLDTLSQSELRIGDRFRLGTATIVVTGPRVPCWKLTWRLEQPKSFMRRFRLSGRSGSYFGVIEPGRVRPGDELQPLDREVDDAPTVAELSALCDSSTRVTAEGRAAIDRALANPHLSRTVRATLDLKLAGIEREAVALGAGWTGWRPFDLEHTTPEAGGAASYVLRPEDGGALAAFRPGQHVSVRLTEPGGRRVVRSWSLSSWEAEPDRYRITVKHLPDGLGAGLLTRAAAGDAVRLELRAPSGDFHLDRGTFRPVILIAAGIGITPMLAMIDAHLARGADMPPLWLLYSTRDAEQTAFRAHLDETFARHRDLHLHAYRTQSDATPSSSSAATVHRGRLTAERAIQVLRGNYLRVAGEPVLIPWFESDIYLCGPEAFNVEVRDGLIAAGANPDLVRFEDFGAAGGPITPERTEDAQVEFGSTTLTWRARDEQTLLEVAEDGGLDVPYDCRAGTCRTCESTLVCGEIDGRTTTLEDGTRRVLLCVSYPRSDHVVIEHSVIEPPQG